MKAEKSEKIAFRVDPVTNVYDVGSELGRGQFAVVKRCTHRENSKEFAAKFIRKKRTRASRSGLSKEIIEREASILFHVDHENIIKLYEAFESREEVALILELMSGGELFEEISEQEYLTEIDACHYTKQALEAVNYLHDREILHLDIKPENVVLKEKGSKVIKLVDFGLAHRIDKGKELKEMMGTPEFVAPEIINYDAIGPYSDMWAVGVMTYILLSGASPFLGEDMQETYRNIVAVEYDFDEEYFPSITEEAVDFIKHLLVKKPKDRNTAKECLNHPWITSKAHHNSVIKTTGFKAFLARRRWQQSFRKVCIVSRFRMLGRTRASVDFSASEEMEKEAKPRKTSVIEWLNLQKSNATDSYGGRRVSKDDTENIRKNLAVPDSFNKKFEQPLFQSSEGSAENSNLADIEQDVNTNSKRKVTLVSSLEINQKENKSDGPLKTPKVVLYASSCGIKESNNEQSSVGNADFYATVTAQNKSPVPKTTMKDIECVPMISDNQQTFHTDEKSNYCDPLQLASGISEEAFEADASNAVISADKSRAPEMPLTTAASTEEIPFSGQQTTRKEAPIPDPITVGTAMDISKTPKAILDADSFGFRAQVSEDQLSNTAFSANSQSLIMPDDERLHSNNNGLVETNNSKRNKVKSDVKNIESIMNEFRTVENQANEENKKVLQTKEKSERSAVIVHIRKETNFGLNRFIPLNNTPCTRSADSSPRETKRRVYKAYADVGTLCKKRTDDEIIIEIDQNGKKKLTFPVSPIVNRESISKLTLIRFPSQPNLSPSTKCMWKVHKETSV